VEDAFLRSVLPGRSGSDPIGLNLDTRGVHFDSSVPSDIEHLLATAPLDDTALLNRARAAIERLRASHLSKYNAFDPSTPLPDCVAEPGFVLVVDQTRGDASIKHGAASASMFREMLVFAQEENPGARVVIKTHPETAVGHREGHFGPDDENARITLLTDPVSPWAVMENARAVYTVSSQLGFEAIFAGHKPRVFGQPFYAGWGLTIDENPVARRERKLTRAQLFAAAMILYPTWYDPCRDRLCSLEDALNQLEAETRTWREDHKGYVAMGMRLWKRAPLQGFFGGYKRLRFEDFPGRAAAQARADGRKLMIWAGKETDAVKQQADATPLIRVEDGFLRSRGLGAELVPPLSLVTDDQGIYYDPSQESRLENLIVQRADLSAPQEDRANALIKAINRTRISKYNLSAAAPPDLPEGRRILVPGQVEDDASIIKGCADIATNLDLLAATRAANPDAVILYKPHPDVEAGLRSGAVIPQDALKYADLVLNDADPIALIDVVEEVSTLTSLLGFEALLRGCKTTCYGTPFYAGWGLTNDLGVLPERRGADVSLAGLVHAGLIYYQRYFDPVSGVPCPPEGVVERLASGIDLPRRPANRMLAKVQGLFASYAHLWRR